MVMPEDVGPTAIPAQNPPQKVARSGAGSKRKDNKIGRDRVKQQSGQPSPDTQGDPLDSVQPEQVAPLRQFQPGQFHGAAMSKRTDASSQPSGGLQANGSGPFGRQTTIKGLASPYICIALNLALPTRTVWVTGSQTRRKATRSALRRDV